MANYHTVWIDAEICDGCGACVETCPAEALTLVDQVAHVKQDACTGCGACMEVCPRNAIQPVVEGEIVPAEDDALEAEKRRDLAPAMDRYGPLIERTAPALAVAGAGLLAKAARALSSAVGRWLTSSGDESRSSVASQPNAGNDSAGRGGRRSRRRRRGG